jgi:hypothetical protein
LLAAIGRWYWNDPVSALYRQLFKAGVVFDPTVTETAFLEDLDRRQLHKIPPGYKDAGKTDLGVGDLLIWNTILEIGKTRVANIVFVSGDEKSDWWHQSENQALFPRFELVDEFRRVSGGKTFYIISFAELLELFGASATVVKEVRQEEAVVGLETTSFSPAASSTSFNAQLAVYRWLLRRYPVGKVVVSEKPDFLVTHETGYIGFEVEYVHSRRTVLRRIREAEAELSGAEDLRALYLVFVVANHELLAEINHLLHRREHTRTGVIAGVLNQSGVFSERFRLDPLEDKLPSSLL